MGVLETNSEKFYWIINEEIRSATSNVRGVNGLIEFQDKIIVGFQSSPTQMIVFNKDFTIHTLLKSHDIHSLHSFCSFDGKLLCVSTGTDEIFELSFSPDLRLVESDVWWRYSDYQKTKDRHHINSIASRGQDVYVTCFGEKSKNGWVETKAGKLINVGNRQILKDAMYHPHTLYFLDNNWILCESGTSSVLSEKGEKYIYSGYLRGLAEDDEHLYIGSSGRRLYSRSQGVINFEATSNPEEAESYIYMVDKENFNLTRKINTGKFGTEIFDMMCLQESWIPEWLFRTNALEIQMSYLENHIIELRTKMDQFSSKYFLINKIIKRLRSTLKAIRK